MTANTPASLKLMGIFVPWVVLSPNQIYKKEVFSDNYQATLKAISSKQ
ncbi:hypothetical protein [Flavobacterium aestivum]|nr:hypothetical protein [Flavobacterium aestivum]